MRADSADLDDGVVDANSDKRRQQMLRGRDQHALLHQTGGVADAGDVAAGSFHFKSIEISPADAAERGIKDGGWVWVTGAENSAKAKMKALVTERVGKGVTWMPFHFGGWFGGEDLRSRYPKGTDPIVLGESVNTLTTYGYDPATGMQEPKATLCQVRAA